MVIHFLVIHLEKDEHRKKIFLKRMKHLPLNKFHFEFVQAIEHENGCEGCRLSHMKCIEIAKERNWPLCWVLEDDVLFLNPSQLFDYFKNDITHVNQIEFFNYIKMNEKEWVNTIHDEFQKVEDHIENNCMDVFFGGSSSFGDCYTYPQKFQIENYDLKRKNRGKKFQGKKFTTPFFLDQEKQNLEIYDFEDYCIPLNPYCFTKFHYIRSHFTGSQCVCYGKRSFDVVLNSARFYHIDQFMTHCGTPEGIIFLKSDLVEKGIDYQYPIPLLNICTIFPFLTIAYSEKSTIRKTNLLVDEELKLFLETEQTIHFWVDFPLEVYAKETLQIERFME